MNRHSHKNLCLIVYKIEKDIGSEDGVGYDITKRLVEDYGHVTLISRENNIAKLRNDPLFGEVKLIGLDVPTALGWFKRKGRGIILYYYLWQYFVGRLVRKLNHKRHFDLVYQLNFHTDWAPHFLSNPHGKVAWGPIVHHPRVRDSFLCRLTFIHRQKARIAEWSKQTVKKLFWHMDPNIPIAIRQSDTILYGNPFLAPPYEKARDKVHVFPYGASVFKVERAPKYPKRFRILFSGRLIPLKGPTAAIDAFAAFVQHDNVDLMDLSLTFLGEGPLHAYIDKVARKNNIGKYVNLPGRLPQPTLRQHYEEAAVFLFPSFESQSLVTAEAMSCGTVPICLANTGPGFVVGDAGLVIEASDYQQLVKSLSEALHQLYSLWKFKPDEFELAMIKAFNRYQNHLTFEAVYNNIDEAIWS